MAAPLLRKPLKNGGVRHRLESGEARAAIENCFSRLDGLIDHRTSGRARILLGECQRPCNTILARLNGDADGAGGSRGLERSRQVARAREGGDRRGRGPIICIAALWRDENPAGKGDPWDSCP